MNNKIITNSSKATKEFAKKFISRLNSQRVLGLAGNLGAGKTVFVQGLAEGLGIKETVNSPTFVLMKIYQSRNSKLKIQNLVHIDAYRIKNPNELVDIGLTEYFDDPKSLVVIEWADKIKKLLPQEAITIKINILKNSQREIIVNQSD